MLRCVLSLVAALVVASSALAGGRYVPLEVSVGTNATTRVTATERFHGRVNEIYFQIPAASTSVVTVVSTPNVGSGLTPTVLYTNAALTANAVSRTRVAQTDNTGANLSSLSVAESFLCVGDPVVFSVTQASAQTGVTFKAWIKLED